MARKPRSAVLLLLPTPPGWTDGLLTRIKAGASLRNLRRYLAREHGRGILAQAVSGERARRVQRSGLTTLSQATRPG